MNGIAPYPVVVPFAAAAFVLGVHSVVPRSVVRALTFAAIGAEVGFAAILVHETHAATIVYWFGGWTPRSGVALGVSFTVDQLGAGAALLAGIVTAAALVTTPATMTQAEGIHHALFLTLLAGMAGFCLTGDLFNMFVFFELMAVSAFALCAFATRDVSALRAALNFALTNSIGAFFVLIGIAILYSRTGALNLAQIGGTLTRAGSLDRASTVALALLFAGFLIKAAVVPFHFWLVDTATSAPIPLVMILAGVLDTLGIYGIARIYWTVFAGPLAGDHRAVQTLLIALGALTALTAGALSLFFGDARRRMAFVMVAHTGVVLIGIGCLSARGLAGAAIYAAGDGAVKFALFIGLMLLGLAGADSMSTDPGRADRHRRAGLAILTIGGVATAGFPLFATGLGKASIEDAAAAAGYRWVTVVVVAAAATTGAAVLNIAANARTAVRDGSPDHDRRGWVPLFCVAGGFLGFAALAATGGRWAANAATQFADPASYQQRVLYGARIAIRAPGARMALSTSGLVFDLIAVAIAAALGTETSRNAIRGAARSQALSQVWAAGRRLHDGSLGDSAAWATVGVATIAVMLATGLR
ncbi:MAG TPA: complex I subunit 5 family protein [Acidimicrobiia bacterium]|nr:complex I subunit 5 family protein [Acidimicrobiia bacterium]